MLETTTNPALVTRRNRVVLTDRLCEKRVERRTKFYDRKCHGLYVSVTKSGVATGYFQDGKGRCKWLGVYNPQTFTVDDMRAAVYALRARMGAGENVFAADRQRETLQAKQDKTVDELIEARVAWMKTPERKADGDMRPRIESWRAVASHLRRFVSPTLGKRLAAEVSRSDVAALSNDIVDGEHGKPSVANARHMRRALSGLYNWAAEAGRDLVASDCQPCLKLPRLPTEHPRKRVLSTDEIRTLWRGLDRDRGIPWDRRTRLALKFALCTMLRTSELIGARRDELYDLDGADARITVPLRRVKKRRTIHQPLNSLAVEIIREALEGETQEYVFTSRRRAGRPLQRASLHTALRGTTYTRGKRKGQTKTAGICELLGLKPFTPHDLRRTTATLAGDLGFSDAEIGRCLDHSASRDESGIRAASVTGKVYVHSRRLQQKRELLCAVDRALREIIVDEPMRAAA
jgi:integrase